MHIGAGENTRETRKLANVLLNAFSDQYGQEDFKKASPN